LYDFLLARQSEGQFILRIEDTDQKRLDPDAENELMASLRWLGLEWDEGPDIGGPHEPYRQSERKDIYLQHALELIHRDYAYRCFCTPDRLARFREGQKKRKESARYDGTCRLISPEEAETRAARGESHVIRFKTPRTGKITVHDELRGDITVENKNLDDYILVKSNGVAVYHLAAMVDDYLMGITHVIRTSEWLPTFPLHVHIYRAFGWVEPKWVHPSIFLKPSGKGKMSKRDAAQFIKGGHSIYVQDLKDMGYLPEAVVNWIALMGWSYDDHTEFFSLNDLIDKFSIERLNPAPAAINFSKFDHFNGLHIRNLEVADLAGRLKPFYEAAGYQVDDEKLLQITPIIQKRLVTLDDAPRISGFFFEQKGTPEVELLIGKNMTSAESLTSALRAYELLSVLPDMQATTTEAPMRELADQLGLKAGQLFGILRGAVTGQKVSPPLFESMEVLGRHEVLMRIKAAIVLLEGETK
jgi:glutamyl-tRNA synthetase